MSSHRTPNKGASEEVVGRQARNARPEHSQRQNLSNNNGSAINDRVMCQYCGEPIEDRSEAWKEFCAFVDGKGHRVPGTTKYTGRLSHDACVEQDADLEPFPAERGHD